MNRIARMLAVLMVALSIAVDATPAQAQRRLSAPFARDADRSAIAPGLGNLRAIAVAKWTAVLGAAGAAAYGFVQNKEADDLFRELERACEADRALCRLRDPNGAYADAALESLYQDVLTHDRASRRALLASQLGIAAGVALFLIDLRSDERPPDIPYEPKRIEVGPRADGGLYLRVWAPFGF